MKKSSQEMLVQAEEASRLLKALSNEHRLIILCSIVEDDFTVNELSEITTLSQSSVSQHLKLLSTQNIVIPRKVGNKVIYKITDSKVKALLILMHALFCS